MAKRRAPNKGKKCVRKRRIGGKLKCVSFGAKKTATKRRKRRKTA